MLGLLHVTAKDLRRWRRDPAGLIIWAAIPLLVAILMKFAFGGSGSSPTAQLVIADSDGTLVTQLLKGAFSQGELADLIEMQEADSAAAAEMVYEGEVSAALFIPKGFTENYLNGRTSKLGLMKNPSQSILPRIVEETLAVFADGAFYLREVFDEPFSIVPEFAAMDSVPSEADITRMSSAVRRPMSEIGTYIFPPVLGVESTKEKTGPSRDFLTVFFPGIIVMAMLFVGQSLAVDMWAEHKLGTFRRAEVSRQGARGLVAGKVLAGVLILGIIIEVLMILGKHVFQLQFENIHLAALFVTVTSVGFLGFLHFLTVAPSTENGGTIISSMVVMPLILLGGSFFPVEALGPGLARIANATPNGWVLAQTKAILFGEAQLGTVFLTAGVAVFAGIFFIVIAGRQARRRFLGGS